MSSNVDWAKVSLGEICELKYGRALPSDVRSEGPYGVYGSNGRIDSHAAPLTNGPAVVVGRKGANFGAVHYSPEACWPIDTAFFVDSTCTSVNLKWLAYRMSRLGLNSNSRAAAIPSLSRDDAYRKSLLLPSSDKQDTIVKILDSASTLREKSRDAIALLDDLAQSIFWDMFSSTAKTTFSLGERLRFVTSGGRGWAKYYSNEGARFIRSIDVRMNKIDNKSAMYVTPPNNAEAKRTTIHDGDVLLTITGSLIGRVAPVPEKLAGGFISQHVAILRIDRASLDPRFLAFFLSLRDGGQSQISRMQYGQTKPGLNFEQIRSLQIPAVPLSGQLAFVARLNGTRDLLSSHRTHLDALGELFDSLQQRSFIGEL